MVCFKLFWGWSSSHNSTIIDFFNVYFEKFIMLVRQLQNDLPAPSDFGRHKVWPEAQKGAPILSSVFVPPMQEVFHWPHYMTFSSVSNMKYPVPRQRLKLWQSRLLPQNFVLEWESLLRMKHHAAELLMNVLVVFSRKERQIASWNLTYPAIMARLIGVFEKLIYQ